jgi:hypothetical protein
MVWPVRRAIVLGDKADEDVRLALQPLPTDQRPS